MKSLAELKKLIPYEVQQIKYTVDFAKMDAKEDQDNGEYFLYSAEDTIHKILERVGDKLTETEREKIAKHFINKLHK